MLRLIHTTHVFWGRMQHIGLKNCKNLSASWSRFAVFFIKTLRKKTLSVIFAAIHCYILSLQSCFGSLKLMGSENAALRQTHTSFTFLFNGNFSWIKRQAPVETVYYS